MSEQVAQVSLHDVKQTLPNAKSPVTSASDTPTPTQRRDQRRARRQKSHQSVIVLPWQARALLIILLVTFFSIGASYLWVVNSNPSPWVASLMTSLWLIAGLSFLAMLFWVWREFTCFGNDLYAWAESLRQNDFSARMPIKRKACASYPIREQINGITEDYQALSRLQLQRMHRQERYIRRKNYHLNVLYDVAAAINRADNLEDLLHRFLLTLQDVVKAEAATVRLVGKDNVMRLVASVGLDDEVMQRETTILATQCTCGKAVEEKSIKLRTDVSKCEHLIGKELFAQRKNIEMLAVPLQYRDKTLGIYNLFVSRDRHEYLEDERELLLSIGRHLGMAIEKASIEEEAHNLSLMEERTRMAHELHDSLAQTLASLRFKVRLFDESLNAGNDEVIWSELEGLEHNIDEAYAELRSLITHFRAPIDGKGVVRIVENLVNRFRRDAPNIEVFFYHNWDFENLSQEMELEVVRIVQEALNNVRKHSQASTVRILMHSSTEGRCSLLVEDDGIGLPDPLPEPNPITGEHIGLGIMQQRAARLNGELQFESDPDEGGTLLQLNFDAPDERKLSQVMKGLYPKAPTNQA